MCHGGMFFLVSPREAPSSLGCSVAALTLSPPVSVGGDIHRYSMPLLFSGSIVVCRSPQRPQHASKQKESMTAWDGAIVWC